MISLKNVKLRHLEKLAVDNSPVLLTAIGVAGTIGTAILTHRAATKAERILDVRRSRMDLHQISEDTRKERVKVIWKLYIPPVASGAVTVGCIVMANHIGTKRAAAMAAAYTISEKAYTEYREKVVEKIGEGKERKIREDIVRDRVNENPPTEGNVLVVGDGDHLFIEMYTGRYFRSTMENVKKAVNEVNYQINTHGYASVSDFYQHVGLPTTSASDRMGWNSDKLMDVDFQAVLSEDGRPCVGINFMTGPYPQHDRFH